MKHILVIFLNLLLLSFLIVAFHRRRIKPGLQLRLAVMKVGEGWVLQLLLVLDVDLDLHVVGRGILYAFLHLVDQLNFLIVSQDKLVYFVSAATPFLAPGDRGCARIVVSLTLRLLVNL